MPIRQLNPVEVLVDWVKHFKAEHCGRVPSKADIPEELGQAL